MAVRPRSLLLAASLGISASLGALGVVGTIAPAGAQDVTTTTVVSFGGGAAEDPAAIASTTVAGAAVDDGPETTQEVTQGTTSESSIFTESRKVLAAIGGLLICALALTLLTIRYARATRPVPKVAPGDPQPLRSGTPVTGTAAALAAAEAAPAAVAAEPTPAPAGPPDHPRADADYEPQGTGEHARIEVPTGAVNRPGRAARTAALGRSGPA